jgi:hypothetical protein
MNASPVFLRRELADVSSWLRTVVLLALNLNAAHRLLAQEEKSEVTLKVSVAQAVRSELPILLDVLGESLKHAPGMDDRKTGHVIGIIRQSMADYSAVVSISDQSGSMIRLSALPMEQQAALERAFDTALLRQCGPALAQRVKFLCIRFLYAQTGAFGKHVLTFEKREGAVFLAAGPLDELEVSPEAILVRNTELSKWLKDNTGNE